ncbi:zeta toxin family protein [Nocardia sp. NPDC051570]|uniref:zeta toxin family protein n=1 Tax=Nocardia sp. NPDC051570 TaxID=3364324 RepID=UPI0037A29596
MADSDAAKHILSAAENKRIFEQRIVPRDLSSGAPQDRPTVVFLVGQPGAGKTKAAEMIAAKLNKRGGFVDIDSDVYKQHHPDYKKLMSEDDQKMAEYIGPDGRAWMRQAEEHVQKNKLNAMVQEISQNPDYLAGKMKDFRQQGFRVEVAAMGVPEAVSNQGILSRYHQQVETFGKGRLSVQRKADESYSGMLGLADLVDRGKLADEVGVYRRGDTSPRYHNELDSAGQWRSEPAFRSAIETERNRPLSPRDDAQFVSAQQTLRAQTRPGGTLGPSFRERLDRVDNLATPLLSESSIESLRAARQAVADDDDEPNGPGRGGGGPGTPHRDQLKKPSRLSNLGSKLKAAPASAAKGLKGIAGRAGGAAGLISGAAGAAGMVPGLVAAMDNPAAFAQGMLDQLPDMAQSLPGNSGGGLSRGPGAQGNPHNGVGAKPQQAGASPNASADSMKKTTDAAKASTDAMKKSTEAVKGSSDGFKKYTSELSKAAGPQKSAAKATKDMAGSQKNLNSAMRSNPLGVVVTAITTAISVITLLVQNWDKVKTAFDWVFKNVLMPVGKWFSDTWSGTVVPMFKASVETVGGFFSSMGNTVSGVWNGIVNTIKGVIGTIGNILTKVPDIGPGSLLRKFGATLVDFAGPDKKADGGLLRGPGGPRDDVIPVLASNGEYVVNAAATAQNLPLLESINSGAVPRFADGGVVHSSWSDLLGEQAQNAASQFFGPSGKPAEDGKKPDPVKTAWSKAFTGFAGAAGNFVSGMVGDALGVFGADSVPYLFQAVVGANNAIAHKRAEDAKPAEENPESTVPSDDSADAPEQEPQPGGLPAKALSLIELAKGVEGAKYDWGGRHWGDCSGAVAALANFAAGWDPFATRFSTADEAAELLKRGAQWGSGSEGSLNIGWYHNGGTDGHTAATLPNGVNFEMGGNRGNGQYGGSAAGASHPAFNHHMHFPAARFLASGGAVRGAGSSIGDLIPAWLSDGEFVVNAKAADANRSLLQAINDGTNGLAGLTQSLPIPSRALAGVGAETNVDQGTTIHMSTPDVDTAFQKAKTWEAQRALTYVGRWA